MTDAAGKTAGNYKPLFQLIGIHDNMGQFLICKDVFKVSNSCTAVDDDIVIAFLTSLAPSSQ